MQNGLAWKLPVDKRPCDLADLTPIRFNTKTSRVIQAGTPGL
jgi:hypothetical protein